EEIAGMSAPVVTVRDGKPQATWRLYLRWKDGRRECRDLADHIELPDGHRLWFHPTPGEPAISASSWSASASASWLGNCFPVNAVDLFKRLLDQIAYFVDFPREVAPGTTALLALWIVLTYLYQAWGAIPYLYLGGPAGSGKTRVFDILVRLVFRALASSNL